MEKQLLHLQVDSKVICRDSINGILGFDLSWGKFSLRHLSSILGGRGAEGVEREGRGDRGDGGGGDEQGRGGGSQQTLVTLIKNLLGRL